MGQTRPNYVGWAEPRPCEQCPPLFACYRNSGGMAGTKKDKKEVEKSLPAVAVVIGGVAGGDKLRHWWWRWQFAVVAATLIFFLLSLSSVFLSLLCFFFFFFFFSFGLPSLFCSRSSFSLPFLCIPLFYSASFCSCAPLFLWAKYRGEKGQGGPCAATLHHLSNTWNFLGK